MADFATEIRQITQTPTFLGKSPDEQQQMLKVYRDNYIKADPENADYYNQESERANVAFLRGSGEGRWVPRNLNVPAPWLNDGWSFLEEGEKEKQLDQFRAKIPEYSKQDQLNRSDTQFYLNALTDYELRKAKGEDTGWVADKAYRAWDGFAAGLASYVGATEVADSIRKASSENPTYDEDFTSQLFQGAGDMLASSVVFIGATLGGTAVTGSPIAGAYVGGAATLGTNSIARFNDAYQQAIESGLSDKQATEAGYASLPGAAIDAIGDKLIAGKFLPNNYKQVFAKGTLLQKQEALAELVADSSKRGIIINSARDAFTEGASEAIGDYVAGYGAYVATGDESFIPKDKEMAQSFLIGAVLGGVASGASELPGIVRDDHTSLSKTEQELERINGGQPTDETATRSIFELLNEGKYKEAYDFAAKVETIPFDESQQSTEAKPVTSRPFLASSEEDELIPFKEGAPIAQTETEKVSPADTETTTVLTDEQREIQRESIAEEKLKASPRQLQEEFYSAVQRQFPFLNSYAGELAPALGVQPFAETSAPARDIRRGVSETGYLVEADGFAQQQSQRYNNISLVDPGTSQAAGTADFSLKDRAAPEGDLQVAASPELQTKVQEAVALGRGDRVRSIAPVNNADQQWLTDNNIPAININSEGIEEREYQEPEFAGEKQLAITNNKGLDHITSQLDQEYGEGKWVVKDSQGSSGQGIYFTKEQLEDKLKQDGELALNGLYAEPKIDALANRGNGDFRVHIVKRGGRMEVVPFATMPRGSSLPYVVRSGVVLNIEEAALEQAEKAMDQVADNALLGVDVVVDNKGGLFVPELNPTQYGPLAESYGVTGASAFAATPYVQSAIYSHLKGRVPAFALAGRKAMRDLMIQNNIAQGKNVISQRIQGFFGNAADSNQLRSELLRTYGEKFADKADDLWNAFMESAGQITQKILDLIQSIIDSLSFRSVDRNVSPANQALMNKININSNIKAANAQALTAKNVSLEPKDTKPINLPPNGRALFETVERDSQFLSSLVGDNEQLREYLSQIPVVHHTGYDGGGGFDGSKIYLADDSIETAEHELSHAVIEYGLRTDTALNKDITQVVNDLRKALVNDKDNPRAQKLARWMNLIERSVGYNKPDYALSRMISANYSKIAAYNKKLSPEDRISFKDFGIIYGLSSPSEFVAELYSNQDFRDMVNGYKIGNDKSLWQRFIDAIKKFFGKQNTDLISDRISKVINNSKYDVRPYSFGDVVYRRPVGNEKRLQSLKRLKALKQHKIDDRFDSNTSSLLRMVKNLKASEIDLLDPLDRNRVYDLINNIHQARSQKAADPEARIDTASMLNELSEYKDLIDSYWIEHAIKEHDGVLDLSGYNGEPGDRDAFTSFLNELTTGDKAFQDAKQNASAQKKDRYNKKMAAWRASYGTIRQEIQEKYPTAEAYLAEYESQQGQPIKGRKLREFVMMHYDYLTGLANVGAMEGGDLYRHFFAVNNLRDFSMMYGSETTAEYIRSLRDSKININSLRKKFRDPVINQGRGALGGLDSLQRATETAQTQLERWSSFIEGKDFLQQDLMGPLLESITIEAANNENNSLKRYGELKKEFESKIEREMNSEDRVALSIASRLIQFETGKDGDAEFINNLKNERKAIENIIGNEEKDGSGTEAQQSEYRNIVLPTLNRLIGDVEESPTPMQDFVININSRLGFGDEALGQARADLMQGMQSLLGEFTVDNQIISEMFYKKPFKSYVNYLPRLTVPINPEQFNAREGSITDEVEKFDNNQFQSNSFTAQPEQLKERSGIGDNAHYSNNIEHTFSRGLHVASLTSATTAERFILDKRLKSGPVRNVINGSNSTYRVDQLQQWARQVMLHAMHSGQPLGTLGVAMKALNENFARVALSGIHQGVTQTISSYTDYQFRTGNIKGAMEAAMYYITNKKKMDDFFTNNASWIGNRSFLGEQELDRRRNIPLEESKIKNNSWVKALSKFHDKAGEIITYSLRKGDDFSARSLVMAEYMRQLQQKNPAVRRLEDVDWNNVEGNILSNAILDIERNINASNKVTRGEFFVDRHRGMAFVRNITVAFSSHVMMLAGQFNIAMRDLIDLHNNGGSKADKARAIRTIGAILGQTLSFSTSRYVINGALAASMIALMRELYDDEEGKIAELESQVSYAKELGDPAMIEAAQAELKAATQIRKQIDKFSQRQTSFQSYWKNAVKDELGVMHFLFNGPQLPQKLIFPVFDRFGELMMKEDQQARVKSMKAQIKQLKEYGDYSAAAALSEDLVLIENQEYMPWNIDQFGNIGLGGITGTALNAVYSSVKEFNDAAYGLNEVNINDFILSAQSAGIGQAELTRFFKTIDKIEDEQFKTQLERDKRREERLEELRAQQAAQQSYIDDQVLAEQLRN